MLCDLLGRPSSLPCGRSRPGMAFTFKAKVFLKLEDAMVSDLRGHTYCCGSKRGSVTGSGLTNSTGRCV